MLLRSSCVQSVRKTTRITHRTLRWRVKLRKPRYNIPKLLWKCPHCGFDHTAADLLRLECDRFQCKSCSQPFPSGTAHEHQ